MTTGAGRHSMWTLTVLRVLTPLGLEASSWRSCLARQSSVSTDSFKLTVTHFLQFCGLPATHILTILFVNIYFKKADHKKAVSSPDEPFFMPSLLISLVREKDRERQSGRQTQRQRERRNEENEIILF